MEGKIMLEIAKRIDRGEKAALVTLTGVDGSSPGKSGSIMGVFFDHTTLGTIGGGNLEFQVINSAIEAMKIGENREFEFTLAAEGSLDMICGGKVRGYIKVFQRRRKLVIAGGGHLGVDLYKLGKYLNMYTVIIDDREEYVNEERFPEADELLCGDIGEILKNYSLDEGSYLVIVTRGHLGDKDALKAVVGRKIAYAGMIGSRKKVVESYRDLMDEGVDKEDLLKIYSPVGLDISNGDPAEIALGIMAEILQVKNNGTGKHMREVKVIIL
ncbi:MULTISPECIES: XdhC family protein [Psychrilyobacter]|uniref:Xanthine dehydrogenase n=1 Tax=Psychrilyobacter piezotolerans TaxID=2293438 RepID=A0ABX9KI67_9FUSO|nr:MULTISPECIES: XdhC/CoxI family protein [Psychrilyobacter]MCS5422628.1 XdhC/CoxI family protein [Psychrilyobacter sp. S5]NDI77633.1 xanthine dehydrogenase [Psychrilyobacter piezotolerans]RDE62642.1 xanthine dehydrogenase [Psychrilyobacter sp. S5]REI41572.1 xanthine dehydrogenase [Psychrilyobacter piezotolerans]